MTSHDSGNANVNFHKTFENAFKMIKHALSVISIKM